MDVGVVKVDFLQRLSSSQDIQARSSVQKRCICFVFCPSRERPYSELWYILTLIYLIRIASNQILKTAILLICICLSILSLILKNTFFCGVMLSCVQTTPVLEALLLCISYITANKYRFCIAYQQMQIVSLIDMKKIK